MPDDRPHTLLPGEIASAMKSGLKPHDGARIHWLPGGRDRFRDEERIETPVPSSPPIALLGRDRFRDEERIETQPPGLRQFTPGRGEIASAKKSRLKPHKFLLPSSFAEARSLPR